MLRGTLQEATRRLVKDNSDAPGMNRLGRCYHDSDR